MSVDAYECLNCGASFGIAGVSTGSTDDLAADDFYDSEVEYHESGQCAAPTVVEAAPTLDPRAEYIKGLRALANLLEAAPELPLPSAARTNIDWNVWPGEAEDVPAELARLRRLIGGQWQKNEPVGQMGTTYYRLTRPLHGLTLELCSYREQVCERVITGTREVVEQVPTAFETVTKVVEDVEWVCKPLLADEPAVTR